MARQCTFAMLPRGRAPRFFFWGFFLPRFFGFGFVDGVGALAGRVRGGFADDGVDARRSPRRSAASCTDGGTRARAAVAMTSIKRI
jgi:hypothetical protein